MAEAIAPAPWQELLGTDPLPWLLASDEPWTRYRTLLDLLGRSEADPDVQAARQEMLAHLGVGELMAATATWGERPLKRHNDAGHPIYAFSTLADFGVKAGDLGASLDALLSHQSEQGAFQTLLNISPRFGGTGEDTWIWLACDGPTLLYALLTMGMGRDPRVQRAVDHLARLVEDNGWRCCGGPEVGRFRGPGRKADPCPIANVYAVKALAQVPKLIESEAVRTGAEMLLDHWEHQTERKHYLFGIGTDFRRLKYPFVWYNILHVADVLSYLPYVQADRRFLEMLETVTDQANEEGAFTASSMYRAWKGWSFADKKNPSPWLTFLVLRILKRVHGS